jgi:putative transposase of IS4/5 family DUF4096
MEGKGYPSHRTDQEWAILGPLLPPPKPGSCPRAPNLRGVVNGIFYVLRGGMPWPFLPKGFPLEDPLSLLPPVAMGWYLGNAEGQVGGAGASPIRPRSHPQGWGQG